MSRQRDPDFCFLTLFACLPSAVRVLLGSFEIVFFLLALLDAFLMFSFAAVRCFVVAIPGQRAISWGDSELQWKCSSRCRSSSGNTQKFTATSEWSPQPGNGATRSVISIWPRDPQAERPTREVSPSASAARTSSSTGPGPSVTLEPSEPRSLSTWYRCPSRSLSRLFPSSS